MVLIQIRIWIRNQRWNQNFYKVETGTALNHYGSTTLLKIAVLVQEHHFKKAHSIFQEILDKRKLSDALFYPFCRVLICSLQKNIFDHLTTIVLPT
jgi:hypothetical protein